MSYADTQSPLSVALYQAWDSQVYINLGHICLGPSLHLVQCEFKVELGEQDSLWNGKKRVPSSLYALA